MLRVVVLGAAAGGWRSAMELRMSGVPESAKRTSELQSTQCSVAVSADGEHWFLINASPDLRQQVTATPQLHPKAGELRHSPIAGVILTNGEIDAVAGPVVVREGSPFTLYAHDRVLAILKSNSIFKCAERGKCEVPADRGGQGVRACAARRFAIRPGSFAVRGPARARGISRARRICGRRRCRRHARAPILDKAGGNTSISLLPARG